MTNFRLLTLRRCVIGVALFALPLSPATVLAIDLVPDLNLFGTSEPDGTYLMEGGRQYVKLVKREEGAPPNGHPVELDAQQLQTVLGAITFQHTGGIITERQEALPVFSPSEVGVLAANLSRGLARARPEEEIIFVVAGAHDSVISKERKGTSGRVFYKDGKLNLIFGEVHKSMKGSLEQRQRNLAAGCGDCPVDERIDPFRIASRSKKGKLDEPITLMTGLDFGKEDGKTRGDWLVLDVPQIIAAIEKQKNRLPPGLEKERRQARLEAAKAAAERRQMREEMARMRKEMQQGAGGSAQSVEERIATLDALKKKGLITPEEYEERRKEILKDI